MVFSDLENPAPLAVVGLADDPKQPFFEGDKVTEETQSMIDFCGRYDAERKRTADLGLRLKGLGLLAGQPKSRLASKCRLSRLPVSLLFCDGRALFGCFLLYSFCKSRTRPYEW